MITTILSILFINTLSLNIDRYDYALSYKPVSYFAEHIVLKNEDEKRVIIESVIKQNCQMYKEAFDCFQSSKIAIQVCDQEFAQKKAKLIQSIIGEYRTEPYFLNDAIATIRPEDKKAWDILGNKFAYCMEVNETTEDGKNTEGARICSLENIKNFMANLDCK